MVKWSFPGVYILRICEKTFSQISYSWSFSSLNLKVSIIFESRLFCVIVWSALNDSKIEGIVTGAKWPVTRRRTRLTRKRFTAFATGCKYLPRILIGPLVWQRLFWFNYSTVKLPYTYIKGTPARVLVTELSGVNMWTVHEAWFLLYLNLYYFMRNFCNLIGLEQWYFSLIWNTYVWKSQNLCG